MLLLESEQTLRSQSNSQVKEREASVHEVPRKCGYKGLSSNISIGPSLPGLSSPNPSSSSSLSALRAGDTSSCLPEGMSENVDLGRTFGAMLIGAMISMGLYGITTLQTYFYFRHYERDALEVKSLVSIVWILDTVHVVFMGHSMYYYLITGFGKPQLLQTGIWSLFSSLLLNIIMAFISQTFFTRQIHFLCPRPWKWLVTTITALIVLAHFVFGIETVVQFFLIKQFSRLNEAEHVAVVPFGTLAILSDILVAAALVILLKRSRTEFEDTKSLINKLIVYAVNRCILTSVVAILEVILFLSFPNSLYAFAFDFVIGKLYANSLLAHLNSRKSLVKRSSSQRGTFTNTSFAVATPGTFSLGGVGSTSTGTSPSSRDVQGDDESRIYSTVRGFSE